MTGEDRDERIALEQAGWGVLSDRILAGLCHDLNGRASALYGLAELNRLDGEQEFVTTGLLDEGRRLEAAVQALQLLSARGGTTAEVLDPRGPVRDAVTAHRLQPGLHGIRLVLALEDDVPPTRTAPALLVRLLLLLLAHASARIAGEATGRLVVGLRTERSAATVTLQVERDPTPPTLPAEPGALELARMFGHDPDEPLLRLAEALGATVTLVDEPGAGPRFEVRLRAIPADRD